MPNRRTFISTTGAATLGTPFAFAATSKTTRKKGWAGGDRAMHEKFGTHWYYNWTPNQSGSKAEFVPMIKGAWDTSDQKLAKIRGYRGVTHLLGFNEPERKDQGNLALQKAIELWPRLEKLAEDKNLKLGSPAPSSDQGGMDYLDRFMTQAKRQKLKVDFIAVHWYRSRDPDAFEDFVKDLGREFRLPVWITEFKGWNGPEKDHYDFLKDSLRFLERSRTVERYAYFEPGRGKNHSLLAKNGSLTRLGELYRDAGK